MSDLIVVAYDSADKAGRIRGKLMEMSKDYLIEMEDAVVAVKDRNGEVKLRQLYNLTAGGALAGGFWGMLIGTIFLSPILGAAIGAGAGAVTGALSDIGINDNFMKDLADNFQPGGSLLFILVRKMTQDRVMAELDGTGGKIIKTSLTHEDEQKLQSALDGIRPELLPVAESEHPAATASAAMPSA